MKRCVLWVLALISALALVCSGCSVSGTSATIEDDGSLKDIPDVITMEMGSLMSIALPSNPTTGYTWNISIDDESIIELAGTDFVGDDSEVVGSGGVEIFTFLAREKGTTSVKLAYAQNWEGGDVDASKAVVFVVE